MKTKNRQLCKENVEKAKNETRGYCMDVQMKMVVLLSRNQRG